MSFPHIICNEMISQQLNYLRRNLKHIYTVIQIYPDEWKNVLTRWQRERLAVIRTLYAQQLGMCESGSNRIDDRIVSLSQPWVRPIVRGKQNAPVEFGAKVGMSDIDGFLEIEMLSWDAFNESPSFQFIAACRTVENHQNQSKNAANTPLYNLLKIPLFQCKL